MPGRRVPPQIAAYLGPCRAPRTPAEKVVEQCGLAKWMGDIGFTDYDPLVFVMALVADEVRGLRFSLKDAAGRRVWIEALRELQDDSLYLEHNRWLPCRTCDRKVRPVVDERLLDLFLAWEQFRSAANLIAIHKCPECGGTVGAAKIERPYKGDMHTPPPDFDGDDDEWSDTLLQYH